MQPLDAFFSTAEAMKQGDGEALRRLYADECEFQDPIAGSLSGSADVVAYLLKVVRPFSDLAVEVLNVVSDGEKAAIEWVQTGTVAAEKVVVHGSAFITMSGDRIARQRDYFASPQ
jgi:limonene-1,2-epoxide hydrolase